jgi:hypothetical protein
VWSAFVHVVVTCASQPVMWHHHTLSEVCLSNPEGMHGSTWQASLVHNMLLPVLCLCPVLCSRWEASHGVTTAALMTLQAQDMPNSLLWLIGDNN